MSAVFLLVSPSLACGGGEPATPGASTTSPEGAVRGEEVSGGGGAEATEQIPFALNLQQPVPPDFRAAYQRRARIAVTFYDTGQDPFYPQGLEVDALVRGYMERLRAEYPTIEFFSYDISEPGTARVSEDLDPGQYGTLAAQLGVGYTPWVATLAPSGDAYVILNVFQGYTPQPVLSQALFELSSVEVEDNTSDLDVTLERVTLTRAGGGIEYFTVRNRGSEPVQLQGFSLRVMDPETGEVGPDSPGVVVNQRLTLQPGESASLGRGPEVTDGAGRPVDGTFEGGQRLELAPGDQLALLDPGGAVAATTTV
ncbi:lamin tail domain-containing protein [Rubrobacter xylanophilus]|uniref:lamin tail domain-containing protein n=1 Tax=Rubrobacter xylanophilus TaxID=49319 RepID=UPI00117A4CBB|nr:lamin tail domain-containing protein [Rubrobacter xylanophilus]